ncbi:porin family protein [Moritella viscosa]|uniref:porin family protein n=1 Tax=Moritella viscosa TaxID=80854 RepID=UPI00406D0EF1
MNKTIGLMVLVLASSAAHAKFGTTEGSASQQSASVAVQAEQKVKGFYLGVGTGTTAFDSLDFDAPNFEDDGNTFKFIAGYQFSRVFALEGQYTQYSDIKNEYTHYAWSPSAISISANLGYIFPNGLRPFGVVGISSIDLEQSYETNAEDKQLGVRYGFGLEYAPTALGGLSARVGYEVDLFVIDDDDYAESNSFTLSSFYASIAYKF